MRECRIAVIGGGPAGLFAARLLALSHPCWQVTVHETLPADDTFGFGVGFTPSLIDALRRADPELHDDLQASFLPFAGAEFRLPRGTVALTRFHAGAIGRARLLRLLLERTYAAGVQVEVGSTVTLDDVRGDADLVIAADGVSSTTRASLTTELGVSEGLGRGWFIWCGSETPLDRTVFTPAQTPGGTFVAHAYPYAPSRSTFVIETSAQALRRIGGPARSFADESASDDHALAFLSEAFRDLLGGGSFVGNRSRWMRFRTVRCARWHHDNILLLGDSAATAHPSIGSGTKLALESAIALAHALQAADRADLEPALAEFERQRRPAVDRLQDRAHRSQLWWESFPSRLSLSPARMALAYLSRAGAVSLDDLAGTAPAVAVDAAADFARVSPDDVPETDLTEWVLSRPLRTARREFGSRLRAAPETDEATLVVHSGDAWGPEADTLVQRARVLLSAGAEVLVLTGDVSRSALLDRLAVGERLRGELGVVVSVATPADALGDAADGLVAGRTDLVAVTGGQ